jgi:hypothetical protein
MKKILTIVILLFLGTVGMTQLSVYTTHQEVCFLDDSTKSYLNCRYDINYISGFVFNDLKTSFKHSIYKNNLTSTFYIDSTINELDQNVYYTTSDVGNKYLFIFNYEKDKVVRIYPMDGSYSIVTRIKIVNYN